MPAATQGAPANLLNVLAEDPSTFEREFGCMTALLQIFNRHQSFPGRRLYDSKRGEGCPVPCELKSCNLSTYYMSEEQEHEQDAIIDFTHKQKAILHCTKSRQCASVRKDEEFSNPSSTPPQKMCPAKLYDECVSPKLSYFEGQSPQPSEYPNLHQDTSRHSFSVQRETSRVSPRDSLDGRGSDKYVTKNSSLEIRDIARRSYYKEKPRMSSDYVTKEVISDLRHMKKLPRSSSVDRRNESSATKYMEFPRSSSANAGTSSRFYRADGATGRTELSRLQSGDRTPESPSKRQLYGNQVSRLTVELEEGPRLGSFKEERREISDLQETRKPLRLNDPSKYERLPVGGRYTQEWKKSSLHEENDNRRRGTNVIARLMGLEEFPSLAEKDAELKNSNSPFPTRSIQRLVSTPAGPPTYRLKSKLFNVPEKSTSGNKRTHGRPVKHGDKQSRVRSHSPKHTFLHGLAPLSQQQETREALIKSFMDCKTHVCEDELLHCMHSSKTLSHEPLHGHVMQRLKEIQARNTEYERETLKLIFEAIHLNDLLHSARRKVVQPTSPRFDTNPRLADIQPQHQLTNEQLTPILKNFLGAHLDMEVWDEAAPKLRGQNSGNMRTRIKQSSHDQKKLQEMERQLSIIVMTPRQWKIDGPPVSKSVDFVSSRCGISERSEMSVAIRASVENGAAMKISHGRISTQIKPPRAQTKGIETASTRFNPGPVPIEDSKIGSSPSRGAHSAKRGPVEAASGRTSFQASNFNSSLGELSIVNDKEHSNVASVTLRNQGNGGEIEGRITNSSVSDVKLVVNNRQSPDAQNTHTPVEVVILRSKRSGRADTIDTTSAEGDAPRNSADIISNPSRKSGTTSTSPKISFMDKQLTYANNCSKSIAGRKSCEVDSSADGANTHLAATKMYERECEARGIASLTLDQNGNRGAQLSRNHEMDSSPSSIRARLQALKDQIFPTKESKTQKAGDPPIEVSTPRGISVRKTQDHECGQGGEEQPSPVSVLDNILFEDECSPSSRSGKTTAINLQDKLQALDCVSPWNGMEIQNLHQLDSASLRAIEESKDENKERSLLSKTSMEMQLPYDNDVKCGCMGVSLANRDKEREFVRHLLVVSGLTKGNWVGEKFIPMKIHNRRYIIDQEVLANSERKLQRESRKGLANVANVSLKGWCKNEVGIEKETLDQRVLFDCVNELLRDKLDLLHSNTQRWVSLTPSRIRWISEGQKLVQEVWEELQDIPCASSADIYSTVQNILRKEIWSHSPQWAEYGTEIGEITIKLERMIIKDLVDGIVKDLSPLRACRKSVTFMEGSCILRRQLFAV